MECSFNRFSVVFEVFQNLLDDCRIFYTGNDPDVTATLATGLPFADHLQPGMVAD